MNAIDYGLWIQLLIAAESSTPSCVLINSNKTIMNTLANQQGMKIAWT